MKKLVVLFLVLALALAACGGPSSVASQSVDDQQASSAAPPSSSLPLSTSGPVDPSDASAPSQTFRLTIPEGYTLARIGLTLEEKGICTAAQFIDAAQQEDFSQYGTVAQQAGNPNRCFRLEGYLFPDTYDFYATATPGEIIRKMLSNTESKLAPLMEEVAASGYTLDEILTLASIIEKEAKGPPEMANISSVLHNRLNLGWKLECDVTIRYVEGAIKPFITGDIDRYNEYYNTYKCPALPAGAICNPGIAAIEAALRPAVTDYLFFLTDVDDNFYYGKTLEEHEENKIKAGLA